MTYRVLTSRPQTERTDLIAFTTPEGPIYFHRCKEWKTLGFAESYEEAREKFGGRPVLELIPESKGRH